MEALIDEIKESTTNLLAKHSATVLKVWKHIHDNPEAGNAYNTAEYLYAELRRLGLKPQWIKPAKSGLYCDIGEKQEGMIRIALRSETDGLRVTDANGKVAICQICGHDAHVGVVCGAGLILQESKEELTQSGVCVRLIFESPEETTDTRRTKDQPVDPHAPRYNDAAKAVAGGAMDDVDIVFASHFTNGELTTAADGSYQGLFEVAGGPITSAGDFAEIAMMCHPAHASRPETTLNIAKTLGHLEAHLEEALKQQLPPKAEHRGTAVKDHSTVSVAFPQLSTDSQASNAMPARGKMSGGIRFADDSLSAELSSAFFAAVEKTLTPFFKKNISGYQLSPERWDTELPPDRARIRVEHRQGVSAVVNNQTIAQMFANAARSQLGPGVITDAAISRGGDTFGKYIEHARLGGLMVRIKSGSVHDIHSPQFEVHPEAVFAGIQAVVGFVRMLGKMIPYHRNRGELPPRVVPSPDAALNPEPTTIRVYEFPVADLAGYMTKEQTAGVAPAPRPMSPTKTYGMN